jgi:hypothetical protein
MHKSSPAITALFLICAACGTNDDTNPDARRPYKGRHASTLLLGQSDNAETVKLIPNTALAVLSSSKAKKATLVRLDGDSLSVVRSRVLLPDDTSETEVTSVNVSPTGDWAVFTHSLETRDATSGAQTSCGGELLFADVTDTDAFGTVLKRLTVGPMPDSVAVSSDGHWVAVANERDSAWGGKCEVPGYSGSVSIIDVSGGVAAAYEKTRVTMFDGDTDGREPESITFGRDDDLVATTLQDSHEVAFMRVSALVSAPAWTSDDIQVVRLPENSLGMDPWPDGIVTLNNGVGAELFAVAGEWNDTLIVIDDSGRVVTNHEIVAAEMPGDLPRDLSGESPLFRPDSLTVFRASERTYLAASLKHSGAVGVWDVTDPAAMSVADVIKIGDADAGTPITPSSIGSEGIAANADGSSIACANEGEGSVSLVRGVP